MQNYSVVLDVSVGVTEEELDMKIGHKTQGIAPKEIHEMVSELMFKLPILIGKMWNLIVKEHPDAEKGFEVQISLQIYKDEDGDLCANGSVDKKDGIEAVLLGFVKAILSNDPDLETIFK
ncbi:hypothetical protein [Aggregatibacter actinomycetemcomitans]|uniref:hypothetical protein n=1 Tax=Aggregatibacter actinomycetemcomitans TaxID=714 RepID=UPI00022AE08A|nr:hypothetical protein [Aggregatibacter actinomycetemcomitans]KOE63897.1 hypothetical protein SCC393_0311075 [Aggregatibacter actinomycetemcomitans serotype e str. SCC393]KOE67412.1 hypothetical protein A160_0201970 [Aggregatibacter actinomycetemcomitans serotype e str. A160]KYK78333.1 hypothetical protein SA2876_04155 [Aggregatibacter actinomycetemcomitans serotype e str. SA2876]